jgi:hypothetical protein
LPLIWCSKNVYGKRRGLIQGIPRIYFKPKKATNKVRDGAVGFVVGFEPVRRDVLPHVLSAAPLSVKNGRAEARPSEVILGQLCAAGG